MADYPSLLNKAHELLQQKERLPEKFIYFDLLLQKLPSETPPEVVELFFDMNQQIENYKQQFAILVQELGTISTRDPKQTDFVYMFFMNFLDLLKLAYSVYIESPEKLQPFQKLLEKFVGFLETNSLVIESPLEQGLMFELSKSAWRATKGDESRESAAKQVGGRLKNHTRKQKRKESHK